MRRILLIFYTAPLLIPFIFYASLLVKGANQGLRGLLCFLHAGFEIHS